MNHGIETSRVARSAHPYNTPVQLYRTQDGWIFLMCMTQKFWELLIENIGHPELAKNHRFATMGDRANNRAELTGVLDTILMTETTEHWFGVLQTKIPVAPVNTLPEALENPFVQATGMIQTVPHRVVDEYRALSNPIKIDGERLETRCGNGLGADNETILGGELGRDDLAELKASGAI